MSNNIGSSNQSDSYSSSSFSCYLARTLKTKRGKKMLPPRWSMSSLITALPESPSPQICSNSNTCNQYHHHPLPPPSDSDNATHFSTPRNQRLGMAYVENNCFSDIDEWLEHANKFCKSFNHNTDNTLAETRGTGNPEQQSTGCNNFLTAQEHELYNIILPSVREESPIPHTITSCINRRGGITNQRTRLISRPKPYDELVNETRRNKLEDDKDVRNKAKHLQLMHRLRRKEEAINDWELQKTKKAMDRMDKIQNELERKQILASARTQEKIYSVREKAEKQKLNLRRSTMKKFKQLQKHESHSSSDASWDSRLLSC